ERHARPNGTRGVTLPASGPPATVVREMACPRWPAGHVVAAFERMSERVTIRRGQDLGGYYGRGLRQRWCSLRPHGRGHDHLRRPREGESLVARADRTDEPG